MRTADEALSSATLRILPSELLPRRSRAPQPEALAGSHLGRRQAAPRGGSETPLSQRLQGTRSPSVTGL